MIHAADRDASVFLAPVHGAAHLPVGGDARGKKLAGVKPAPPRKNFVRGGAGFMPAEIPTANRKLRPSSPDVDAPSRLMAFPPG
jgi:hypothetical protein